MEKYMHNTVNTPVETEKIATKQPEMTTPAQYSEHKPARGEGYYMYGIISTEQEQEFGPMGIGERGDCVHFIRYRDLAAIVSASPIIKYAVTRANSMAHMKVLEKAMENYTVLPVRFCTIAESSEIIIEKVLKARYQEFIDLLAKMEGKMEISVRARWTDLNAIFAEVVEEHHTLKASKEALLNEKNEQKKYAGKIKVGQMVQKALEEKKKREAHELLDTLKPFSLEYKENQIYGDMNLVNVAFLITREQEQAFDLKMQELEKAYGTRKQLRYIGPVAPYNFVEVVVNW
jgi:hypothetical protein